MARRPPRPPTLDAATARRLWLRAQRLDSRAPFGVGPQATRAAVEHLGYVQIDTINVIERSHHHILFSRIPDYRREDLIQAQSADKSVFEYWTHALAYVPVRDYRYFVRAMREDWRRHRPFGLVKRGELARLLARIEVEGPLTIRDIEEERVEKRHLWASRKPSKLALELGFYRGELAISRRSGMLKTYELTTRHFGWEKPPAAAREAEIVDYMLDRALTAQGFVSLDSICHLDAPRKPAMRTAIERRMKRRALVEIAVEGAAQPHWARPGALEVPACEPGLVHILSPFDPLIIQRRRLQSVFGYDHVFEAYVPREKRLFGYFTLPVLLGDAIVAAIDLKADRAARRLLIQAWHWIGSDSERHKPAIEAELERFARFQFGD